MENEVNNGEAVAAPLEYAAILGLLGENSAEVKAIEAEIAARIEAALQERDLPGDAHGFTLAEGTQAPKAEVMVEVRKLFAKHVLPYILENLDGFYKGNGENVTTGRDVISFQTSAGRSGPRLQWEMCGNYWGQGKTTGKAATQDSDAYTISQADLAKIDPAIANAKKIGDVDTMVRLMTIKETARTNNGKVNKEQLKTVLNLG